MPARPEHDTRPRQPLGIPVNRFAWFIIATLVLIACGGAARAPKPAAHAHPDLGVDAAQLSHAIENPYVAFARIKRAVYEGKELDAETGKATAIRVISTVRDEPETVAGVKATAVDVADYEDGEVTERTVDYYAQDRSGAVYYLGEQVADLQDGKVVGHHGAWMAGQKGAHAGLFMTAIPRVGDAFQQERAPGVAQDQSRVVGVGLTVTVPAGTFKDCIETEDSDPITKTSQRKIYCKGKGLVRESSKSETIELVELEVRPASPAPGVH